MGNQRVALLIAPDSFKGSFNASDVATFLAHGVGRVLKDRVSITILPMADGGEGTSDIAVNLGGIKETCATQNIYGEPDGGGFWVRWGSRAIVEAAVGSKFIPEAQRKFPATRTTSFGTGLLVSAAMAHPAVDEVLVALGGTGSTDGGIGFLEGVGAKLQDDAGRPVTPFGENLGSVAAYQLPPLPKPLIGLYDVAVPLLGDRGAVRLFGPQKGLGGEDLLNMERAMEHWADVVQAHSGQSLALKPGAGAAGGMGFGILASGGTLRPGAEAVAEWGELSAKSHASDWIITGEGRMDAQTEAGKAANLVIRQAEAAKKPVIAVVGSRTENLEALHQQGLTLVLPIPIGPMAYHEVLARTPELLETVGEEIGWLIRSMINR